MRQKISGLFSLAFIIITSPLIAAAQGGNPVAGRWDLVVQGTDAPYTSWLEVTSDAAGRLNGRFVGRFGSVRPIKDLSFDQGTLNFQLPRQFEARAADLVFTGKLENGRTSGTTIGEDGKTLTWTGVPAPALPARQKLAFGKPVQLFNGRDLRGWQLRSSKNPGCWSVRMER